MVVPIILLLVSFALIVGGAALFTNAVEWLGVRLGLGESAVGSILAAVATVLPESLIPVIALISGGSGGSSVALGAIVGAPFLLATLAMLLIGASAIGFAGRRRQGRTITADAAGARRDLLFFLPAYALAGGLGLGAGGTAQAVGAAVLVAAYVVYLWLTLRGGGESSGEGGLAPLRFDRTKSDPPSNLELGLQLLVSLAMIVGGAELFVSELEQIAHAAGVDVLILALLLAPLATELPEKANSIFWVREGKDTLAVGNVTGAMVFQSTLPVAVGLLFTDWDFGHLLILATACGLAGGLLALWRLGSGVLGRLSLVAWSALYAVFAAFVVASAL